MSYFDKKKIMLWVVIAVIIINFTAIGTIIYMLYHTPHHRYYNNERPCVQTYLEDQLNLSPSQAAEFKKLKEAHHDSVMVLKKIMKEKRTVISGNMTQPEPDTALLYKTTEELGAIFVLTRKLYIQHYFDLRKICNPDQQKKLAEIFSNVFCHEDGCSGPPPDKRCGGDDRSPDRCGRRLF